MRSLVLLAAGLATSSCTTVSRYTPTMASDPPVIGTEASILRNEMLLAFEKVPDDKSAQSVLCRIVPESFQNRERHAVRSLKAARRDRECYRYVAVAPGPNGKDQIRSYLLSGMALTDYYCSVFFERIAAHSAKRRWAPPKTSRKSWPDLIHSGSKGWGDEASGIVRVIGSSEAAFGAWRPA